MAHKPPSELTLNHAWNEGVFSISVNTGERRPALLICADNSKRETQIEPPPFAADAVRAESWIGLGIRVAEMIRHATGRAFVVDHDCCGGKFADDGEMVEFPLTLRWHAGAETIPCEAAVLSTLFGRSPV